MIIFNKIKKQSRATIDRKKGNGITTMKIDDLCKILKYSVSDIIEYFVKKAF